MLKHLMMTACTLLLSGQLRLFSSALFNCHHNL